MSLFRELNMPATAPQWPSLEPSGEWPERSALCRQGVPDRSGHPRSVVATQLAQTLEVGRVEGTLSRQVVGAVAGSVAVLFATIAFPPLQNLLGLQMPSAFGWGAITAASGSAVLLDVAESLKRSP